MGYNQTQWNTTKIAQCKQIKRVGMKYSTELEECQALLF